MGYCSSNMISTYSLIVKARHNDKQVDIAIGPLITASKRSEQDNRERIAEVHDCLEEFGNHLLRWRPGIDGRGHSERPSKRLFQFVHLPIVSF